MITQRFSAKYIMVSDNWIVILLFFDDSNDNKIVFKVSQTNSISAPVKLNTNNMVLKFRRFLQGIEWSCWISKIFDFLYSNNLKKTPINDRPASEICLIQ